jgi:hypothetical protein
MQARGALREAGRFAISQRWNALLFRKAFEMLQRDHALGRFMFADEDDARRWSEFRLLLTLRGSQRGERYVN